MATLKEVQIRIQGIRNTQKITKAMKIVAATKLKKHERVRKEANVYSAKLDTMLRDIVKYSYHPRHKLLHEVEGTGNCGILIIGSDRGLCGSFNTNLFRKTVEYLESEGKCQSVKMIAVGKRTFDFFKKQPLEIIHSIKEYEKQPMRELAQEIGEKVITSFLDGSVNRWCIVSNRFTSRINFAFSHDTLLPVMIAKEAPRDDSLYMFEDNVSTLLDSVVPRYVFDIIYRAIVESQTAEETARMMAMDYATENAEDLIGELTLFYNRTRQQVITKEISEIVGGAEALK